MNIVKRDFFCSNANQNVSDDATERWKSANWWQRVKQSEQIKVAGKKKRNANNNLVEDDLF